MTDTNAFIDAVARTHAKTVARQLRRHAEPSDDVDDAVQEAVLAMLVRVARSGRAPRDPSAYLYVAARRALVADRKRRSRWAPERAEPQPDPESAAVRAALAAEVQAVLRRHSATDVDLLWRHVNDGVSYVALAREIGMAPGALRMRVFRLKEALRQDLAPLRRWSIAIVAFAHRRGHGPVAAAVRVAPGAMAAGGVLVVAVAVATTSVPGPPPPRTEVTTVVPAPPGPPAAVPLYRPGSPFRLPLPTRPFHCWEVHMSPWGEVYTLSVPPPCVPSGRVIHDAFDRRRAAP